MLKKVSIVYVLLCIALFQGCTKQEGNEGQEDDQDIILNPQDIQLSIEDNAYLEDKEILIQLPEGLNYSLIKVFLGTEMVLELTHGELNFKITPENFSDGVFEMKVEVLEGNKVIGRKIIKTKIDTKGPMANFGILIEDKLICGGISLPLEVLDLVSEVSSVKAFWGQEEIALFSSTESGHSFVLDFGALSLGERYLKLEMEDTRNNVTQDSVLVKLAKEITQINFPHGFVRSGIDKVHVILSEPDGTFISSVTHSSGLEETLSICSTVEIDQSSEFILTFVTDFQNAVFNIFPYHNLTLNLVGPEINLAKSTGPRSTHTVDIELPGYKQGDYIRASGQWSSALNYQGNILSGHFSGNFTVESLESNKFFIMNFNPNVKESYKWAFIENPYTFFKLEDEDFRVDNVVHSQLNVVGTNLAPFVAVYGFENEAHFESLITHMAYWNPLLNRNNGYDYSYASIFHDLLYSIKVSNYSIEGLGAPPTTVTVPYKSIHYSFQNNTLSFSGLADFEVGRAQFRNNDSAHILIEMFFDGKSSEVVIPKMPEFLGSQLVDMVNNGNMEIIQCVVEDYSGIRSYEEYITKIVVPSVPFYKVSPTRERVFRSSVSTSLLPMTEFPFHQRL